MSNKTLKNKTLKLQKKNKTQKRRNSPKHLSNKVKSQIVIQFMEILNLIKLYHWKTRVYSQHKATDELYEKLGENIDQFVEVLLGKDAGRIEQIQRQIRFIDSKDTASFKTQMFEFRAFLIDLDGIFNKKEDSDLLNIRDEMLGHINQFLYLLSFTKV